MHDYETFGANEEADPGPGDPMRIPLAQAGAAWKWVEASDGYHEAYDLVRDRGEESNLFVPDQGVPPGFEPLGEASRPSLALATTRP